MFRLHISCALSYYTKMHNFFRSLSSKSSSRVPNSTSSDPESVKKDKEQQRMTNSVTANTVDINKCCWHPQLKGRLSKKSLQASELKNKEKSPLLTCTPRSEHEVVVNLTQQQEKDDRDRLKTCHLEGYDNSIDEELERKARAAEEQAQLLLLEDMEYLTKSSVKVSSYRKAESENVNVKLLQLKVKRLLQEKRNLFLQVACETRSRIAERCAAKKDLEQEKIALRSRLEKEWEDKMAKIKTEVKRWKDRLQDFVEKNVALQRQVSHLNNKESIHLKSQVGESAELKTRLMEAENEIAELRQSLSESCQRTKEVEDNLQSIQRCYDEKEVENYALQGSVIRLHRMCNDQEDLISGLRQVVLQDTPQEKVNNDHMITKSQQEELLSVSTASMTCTGSRDMESIDSALLSDHEEFWPSFSFHEQQSSEVQEEMKAQNLRYRLLGEKLCSRELQVEQLKEEVVSLRRSQKISKNELERLQNLLGSAIQNVAGLELESKAKDEKIEGLENEWYRCVKRVDELEKRVEKLDEEVMLKDGQISILRGSLREIYFGEIS